MSLPHKLIHNRRKVNRGRYPERRAVASLPSPTRHQPEDDNTSTISGLVTAGTLLMETFNSVPDSSPDPAPQSAPDPTPDFGDFSGGGAEF